MIGEIPRSIVTPSSMLFAPVFDECPPLRTANLQSSCAKSVRAIAETSSVVSGCTKQVGVSWEVNDQYE